MSASPESRRERLEAIRTNWTDLFSSELGADVAWLLAEVARLEGESAAMAKLCQQDVAFWGGDSAFVRTPEGEPTPCLLVNDYFAPAADAEPFAISDAPALWETYRAHGMAGIYAEVARRRGVPNLHWRDAARATPRETPE